MFKIYVFATFVCLLAACAPAAKEEASATLAPEEHHDYISLTEAQFKQAGIVTGSFSQQHLPNTISAVAEVILAPEYSAQVSTLSEGIIQSLRMTTNQYVKKGQVLAVVYKPDLLELQQEFLTTQANLPFLVSEYERYKALAAENATAQRNLQKARADLAAAETTLSMLSARLQQLNIEPNQVTASQLTTTIQITAPISGHITRILLSPGAAVGPGTAICSISDFTKVSPVVYVYEKDIPAVKIGAKIRLHLLAAPDQSYPATIVGLGGAIDLQRKALPAYARFDEPMQGLVTGAIMEASIELSQHQATNVLPVDAVIRESDGEYIFVMTAPYQFHKVAVKTGKSDGRVISVTPLEKIEQPDKIVIKGAYYVSAEGTALDHEH